MVNREFDPRTHFRDVMESQEFQTFYVQYEAAYSAICTADRMVMDFDLDKSLGIERDSKDARMLTLFLAHRVLRTQIYDLEFSERIRRITNTEFTKLFFSQGLSMVEEYINDRRNDAYPSVAEGKHVRTIELAANEVFATATASHSEQLVTKVSKPDKSWLKGWSQRWSPILSQSVDS